ASHARGFALEVAAHVTQGDARLLPHRAEGGPACEAIGLEGHARGCRPRRDELQPMRLAAFGEEAASVAHDDRELQEVEFVDEVVLEEPSNEGPAAVDLELATRPRLQLTDGRPEVSPEDLAAMPCRI